MGHRQRERGEHLHDDVAVADGVDRVARHAREAQLGRDGLSVDREARPREGPRPERGFVGPPDRIARPTAIALEHLDVREEVVCEQDRLRGLHVGVAGHDRRLVAAGEPDERPLELDDRRIQISGPALHPEAQVGRDLVVARAAGVELARGGADARRQRHLDVEVDVLEGRVPGERAGPDVALDRAQAVGEGLGLGRGQEAGAPQPADMRERACDVVDAASSRSTSIERPNSAATASGSALKRPPQAFTPRSHASGRQPTLVVAGASVTVTGRSPRSGSVQVQADPWRAASVLSGSPKMRMKPTAAAWSYVSSASYVASARS